MFRFKADFLGFSKPQQLDRNEVVGNEDVPSDEAGHKLLHFAHDASGQDQAEDGDDQRHNQAIDLRIF